MCLTAWQGDILLRIVSDEVIIRADKREKTAKGANVVQDAAEKILEGKFNDNIYSLEFSSPVIELSLHPGEIYGQTIFLERVMR